MSLSRIRTIRYSQRRSSNCLLRLLNFSSSTALKAVEFNEESSSCDNDYVELHGRMRRFAAKGELGRALQTLDFMRKMTGKPTVDDFNALIYSYFKSGNVVLHQLLQVLGEMERSGPVPNELTYKGIYNGMLRLGYLEDAYFTAQRMFNLEILPSYESLMRLLKKSLRVGKLDHTFNVLQLMLKLEYVPTSHSINSYIFELTKLGMVVEACRLLYYFFVNGHFRFARSCDLILWALCKSGKSYYALEFSYLIKKKGGIVLNDRSYTALLYGFLREGLMKEAYSCWRDMQSNGCKPNLITYTVLLKSLLDRGNTEGAHEVLVRMEDEGWDPDLYIYNIITRELCCRKKIANVTELFESIESVGLEPDLYTYSAIVGGLVKAGMGRNALGIFRDLVSQGCRLDRVMYNIAYHYLCREERSGRSSMPIEGSNRKWLCANNASHKHI